MQKQTAVGRKKKVNPLGDVFLRHYLDPLEKSSSICQKFEISSATYFRYVQRLNVPIIRVGVSNYSEQQNTRAVVKPSFRLQRYDLAVIRCLGYLLGVRFKIFAFDILTKKLKAGAIDMAVGRLSWTRPRARDFYCSLPYEFTEYPHGVLFKNPRFQGRRKLRFGEKLVLGVIRDSVHSEYAHANLNQDFEIREFTTLGATIRALRSQQADRVLLHSAVKEFEVDIEADSKKIIYDSYTTILVSRSAEWLVKPLNQALAQMHDKKIFPILKREADRVS